MRSQQLDTTFVPYEELTLCAGGVRVKFIEDHDGNKYTNKREFIYKTDFDGEDSGILLFFPRYIYYTYLTTNHQNTFDETNSSGVSINSFGEHICYSSVIEEDYNGYIRYDFSDVVTNPDDTVQNVFRWDVLTLGEFLPTDLSNLYRIPNSHSYERGKIIKKTIFNSNKDTIQSISNKYATIDENKFITSKKNAVFTVYTSKNYLSACPMIKTTVRNFSTLGQFINELVYTYGYNEKGLKNNEKLLSGTNVLDEFYLKYAYDLHSVEPYATMVSKNILSPIVEQSEERNNQLTQKTVTDYKNWGNNLFAPEFVKQQTKTQSVPETRSTYHNYDRYGNPVYLSKDDATKIVYLWGYNHQYPVAEIKNAAYSDVIAQISGGQTTIDNMAASDELSSADSAKLDALRTKLPNASITTYTYKPLVGMTSKTDPSGFTTYYDYDDFGRLTASYYYENGVKKVPETYDYHYKDR
jgi:hypothetical protein